MTAAAALTTDPQRLAALCELWRSEETELWITLQGGSMIPTIHPGASFRLHCRAGGFQVGDILAFRRDGCLVVHRLIRIEAGAAPGDRRLICQGDANRQPDSPISMDEVVGFVGEIRNPSRLRQLARQTRGALGRVPALRTLRRVLRGQSDLARTRK